MIKTDSGIEVPCEIADHDDGQYFVKYTVDHECTTNITVLFRDDKDKMVPVRGSPYSASFSAHTKAD
jgi:Filamin/ABP280 repeat